MQRQPIILISVYKPSGTIVRCITYIALYSSPAQPLKAHFRFLYSSPGFRCRGGKGFPLEEKGQVYVHAGEGD
jgi:hypothetical protein